MKHKVTVVFNTCNIGCRENYSLYVDFLSTILAQQFDGFRLVLSSCLNSSALRRGLTSRFGDKMSYCYIDSCVPVNITFNQTVRKMVEAFGPSTAYLYVDSGVSFGDDQLVIQKLYDLHTSGPYGITAGRTDTDAGTFVWFGKGQNQQDESGQEELFANGHFEVPIGKTMNLHLQLFDHALFEAYDGRILPDIFASHATESAFTFMTAGIGKKVVWCKDVLVKHLTGMDGASAGFRPEVAGIPGWKHTLACAHRQIIDIVEDPEAKRVGFGHEECQNILMHDPAKYTADGFAIEPEPLKRFVLENLYLPSSHFRYDLLDTTFVP